MLKDVQVKDLRHHMLQCAYGEGGWEGEEKSREESRNARRHRRSDQASLPASPRALPCWKYCARRELQCPLCLSELAGCLGALGPRQGGGWAFLASAKGRPSCQLLAAGSDCWWLVAAPAGPVARRRDVHLFNF
jgi:hypothetical protein